MSTAAHDPHANEPDAHAVDSAHAHDPHLAHHFDTPEQQFSTSKLGMWTFLATEVLMFGGLFCVYAVYRFNHPAVYLWAHNALNPFLGMVNTIVLLASSFTMAWGVRAAQMNKPGLLKLMLALTFLGGVIFMVVKSVEYKEKWENYLFPGKYNSFNTNFVPPGTDTDSSKFRAISIKHVETEMYERHGETAEEAKGAESTVGTNAPNPDANLHPNTAAGMNVEQVSAGQEIKASATVMPVATFIHDGNAGTPDAALVTPPAFIASGTNPNADKPAGHVMTTYAEMKATDQTELNAFFSIYFMMTGLHAVHVLVGLGIMVWLFIRTSRGDFNSGYFTPVDLGGLYWHLVDLIWIFLFPLLYLIH